MKVSAVFLDIYSVILTEPSFPAKKSWSRGLLLQGKDELFEINFFSQAEKCSFHLYFQFHCQTLQAGLQRKDTIFFIKQRKAHICLYSLLNGWNQDFGPFLTKRNLDSKICVEKKPNIFTSKFIDNGNSVCEQMIGKLLISV